MKTTYRPISRPALAPASSVLFGLLGAFLVGCGHQDSPKSEALAAQAGAAGPSSAISIESPKPCSETRLKMIGRLAWDDNVTTRLFSPFAGRVARILVEPGTAVKKGDALALIESPDYGQAQSDAAKAFSDRVLAEGNLARVKDLFDHGAAPAKDLATAEAEVARTKAESSRASARLSLYGGVKEQIDQHYTLRSPIDGIVVEKSINPGQEVRPDQMLASTPQLAAPLFVVTDPTRLWALIDVAEQDLAHVAAKTSLGVRAGVYGERTFQGQIDYVSDSLDPGSRTVRVRASVSNADRLLKAEMLVTAELSVAQQGAVEISSKAVFLQGDRHYVILQDGAGKYSKHEVVVGREADGRALILKGLTGAELVVSEGAMLIAQAIESGDHS
ncbi:MAG: efflux RND transporter periplasmic adaptor subunit [Verrucomicrobia bacterium]|nr:efflux RND transporter periplasmic adaptor subunit [Verrucomicrobiota bacterium]MBI3868600.1 efflux RND transporter periplasmic adaptor subunit [Verrucomicrobiota bacterium]